MPDDNLLPGQQALVDEGKSESEEKEAEEKSGEGTAEEAEPQGEGKEGKEGKEGEQGEDVPQGTPYAGRFKQFKTVEDLEKSYANSFSEAQRLNDRIRELEAKKESDDDSEDDDSEIERLKEEVASLKQDREAEKEREKAEQSRQFDEWMDAHPDIKDNEPLIKELLEELGFAAQKAANRHEPPLSMTEGLNRAWKRINPAPANDEATVEAAETEGAKKAVLKDMAASPAPSGAPAKKTDPGASLTEDEKRTAKAYSMTYEQYAELKKNK